MSAKNLCFNFAALILVLILKHVISETIIETKYGKINGKIENFNGKEMKMFLGIPYAEPPLGQLRFKKPIPLQQQWKETRDATQWPNACVQSSIEIEGYTMATNKSEDCLYLNVFAPLSNEINENKKSKAVMVWIHGGALTHGTANSFFSPHYLSIATDVIIVSIHYRLGIFGFLYSGTDDAPGNVGLWDQVLALKWVKENIKEFGGDSQNITIFGVSAGGWSVSLHILSPASRHLFQNAIVMSGAVYGDIVTNEPLKSKLLWSKAAQSIGCGKNNTEMTSLTPEALECLMNFEPNKLALITRKPFVDSVNFIKLVVHDTEFLPKRANVMLKEGNYKKNVNLMISFTNDEGSFVLNLGIDSKRYGKNRVNLTRDEAFNELKKYSSMFDTNIAVNGYDVAELYFTGVPQDYDILPRTIGIAIGDYLLSCQTYLFGKSVYSGDHRSNVYQYYYSRKPPATSFCAEWMGACHGVDFMGILGMAFNMPQLFTDEDRHHSEKMMNMFGHFAKHGYPSPQFGIEWPKYYTINGNVITPYYEFSHNESADKSFNRGLKYEECDILWKLYIEN